jgi:putative flavoprotein involved in K+ transport
MTTVDTLIVGAGQAGLGVSYFLKREGFDHIVLERGRVGETWLSQRWDSFRLNTPPFMNTLPGLPSGDPVPDGFWPRDQLVAYFESYVKHFLLPVRTGVTVLSVELADREEGFLVRTRPGELAEETVVSRSIVIACGSQNVPKIPQTSSRLPDDIKQLHSADYRNAAALPPGAVLVVGSGQSGCQITEDLLSAGRIVYLCTGKVGRAPRRYRGRDLLEWWIDLKVFDQTYESLKDKAISRAAQPHISGIGHHGHTVSLQQLARQGVVVLGRLVNVDADTFILSDEAAAHVRFADEFSQHLKDDVDAYLARTGITPPPLEDDPADEPDPQAAYVSPTLQLNLRSAGVSTVIWATGFTPNFNWIHLPAFSAEGAPIQERGVSPVHGLYFIGFPWLYSRKSGILYGVEEDAHYLANAIAEQLR